MPTASSVVKGSASSGRQNASSAAVVKGSDSSERQTASPLVECSDLAEKLLASAGLGEVADIAMELRMVLNKARGVMVMNWRCKYIHTYLRRLSVRRPLRDHPSIPFLHLNLTDVLHDGRCFGKGPWCNCNGKSGRRFHGTSDLVGVVSDNGVMKKAVRTARDKQGWYSFPAKEGAWFERALMYSRPQRVGSHASHEWRVVLEVDVECYNTVPGTDLHYTKDACRRYSIVGAYIVTADAVSFVHVNSG